MNEIILIIILQLLYVPMLTLRTISMVKKLTLFTAMFGFLESLIYVFGLAIVFSGEQSIWEMLVYAIGFSLGLIVGINVERKIAIGFISVVANISHKNEEMIKNLREHGFGVTVFQGEGKDSYRYRLDILTKRTREIELMQHISLYEPNAFVIAYEPTRFQGGYLTDLMKRQNRRHSQKFANSANYKNITPNLDDSDNKKYDFDNIPLDPTKDIPTISKDIKSVSWIKKTAEEIFFELYELTHKDD